MKQKRAESFGWCLEHCEGLYKRCPACADQMAYDSYRLSQGGANHVFTAKFWCHNCDFYSHVSFDLCLTPIEEFALGDEID